MQTTMTFSGAALRRARLARGLRREELAVATRRSVESIRGYERGQIDPPSSIVARLAEAVGVDPGALFERVDAA
jgi:transcriptional regulator with XRE-family HTH domain